MSPAQTGWSVGDHARRVAGHARARRRPARRHAAGRARSGTAHPALRPTPPSPASPPAHGGWRRPLDRGAGARPGRRRTAGDGPSGARRNTAAEVQAGDVVGEDGVPPSGHRRHQPLLRRRLAGVGPPPPAGVADRRHHLEQGVEIDPMTAGQDERRSARSRMAPARAGASVGREHGSRPLEWVGEPRHQRRRPELERQRHARHGGERRRRAGARRRPAAGGRAAPRRAALARSRAGGSAGASATCR